MSSCIPCANQMYKTEKKETKIPNPCMSPNEMQRQDYKPQICGKNCYIEPTRDPRNAQQCLAQKLDFQKCAEDHNLLPKSENSPLLSDSLTPDDFKVHGIDEKEPTEPPECYMPQPEDVHVQAVPETMGPIGPWATGRVDWSPLAGLTGTRPVVDHYSITRFSSNEWRARNADILNGAQKTLDKSLIAENDSKNIMIRTFGMTDKSQLDSTNRIRDRARNVDKWKQALERAINAMITEISTLEEQRLRLKKSLAVLRLPESIASECIDRRTYRPETELVRDQPEEELINEIALISVIKDLLNKTLEDIEAQQLENRIGRARLEYDWSDKKDAYELESINCGLNNLSTIILFKPGATRLPIDQSSEEYWEHFSKETLDECELCRQKSITLRGTLDAILLNASRDLRNQADAVDTAFTSRINCMNEIRMKLEVNLKDCLDRLAEIEKLIDKLTRGMKNMDCVMKVAQTRLDNKNHRHHVEDCREKSQYGLIKEVQIIQDGVSGMLAALNNAEKSKLDLMNTRAKLEQEIMLKRRSILLDNDRCMLLRSHFPSVTAMSGYA